MVVGIFVVMGMGIIGFIFGSDWGGKIMSCGKCKYFL